MIMQTLTLYTKPVPVNQRQTLSKGRLISTKLYRETKEALQYEAMAGWEGAPLTGDLNVSIDLYFGDKRKRDIDSYLKIILDSLEGVAYENDNQVVRLFVCKLYDKENPRTEITISTI